MRNASKVVITCLAMVLSVVGLSASAGETKMTTWTVAAGRFSVAMPAKPTYSSEQSTHRYSVKTDGGILYMVAYSDFPDRPVVENIAKGWAQTGRVLRQNTFTFDGMPGIHAVVESKGGARLDLYAVADGNRIYQVVVGTAAGASVPPEATEFVRSFKILRS